jgi:tetratricopeptide (TPR) repeat protein
MRLLSLLALLFLPLAAYGQSGDPRGAIALEFMQDISDNRVEQAMSRISTERAWTASGLTDTDRDQFDRRFRQHAQGLITRTIIWPTLGSALSRIDGDVVTVYGWRGANEIPIVLTIPDPSTGMISEITSPDLGINIHEFLGKALGRLFSGTDENEIPELIVARAAYAMLAGERMEPWFLLQSVSDQPSVAPQVHVLLGLLSIDRFLPQDAVAHFAEAGTPGAAFLTSISAMVGQDALAAEIWAEKATGEHPEDPRGWALYAGAMRRKKKLDKAAEAYLKAIEQLPTRHPYLRSLAEIYYAKGDLPNAEKYTILALQHGADRNVGTTLVLARYRQKKFAETLEALEQYGAEFGPDGRALLTGRTLEGLGKQEEALEAYQKGVDAVPNNRDLVKFYADALIKAEKWAKAETAFAQYLAQIEPSGPEYFRYCEILSRLDRHRECMLYLRLAMGGAADPKKMMDAARASEHLTKFRESPFWKTFDQ